MIRKFPLEYAAFFLVLLLFSFLYLLGNSESFQLLSAKYTNAILLDLFLTLPIGYYLLIRKTKVPNFSTLYIVLLSLLLSGFILPEDHQSLLQKIKVYAFPIIEMGILSMIGYKMWSLRKSYQNQQGEVLDFYDKLLATSQEIFPKRLASVLTTEISVFYYLFKPKRKESSTAEEYSYDRKSGIKMVIGVILFLVIIETFVVHLLVAQWNTTAAWVLTFLSLYAGFQILSILRSMSQRPILINQQAKEIVLRYGHAAQTTIPICNIEQIERTRKSNKSDGQILLTPFDLLDTHNLTIHLKKEHKLIKIYGLEKSFTGISFFVDEHEKFALSVENLMKHD